MKKEQEYVRNKATGQIKTNEAYTMEDMNTNLWRDYVLPTKPRSKAEIKRDEYLKKVEESRND